MEPDSSEILYTGLILVVLLLISAFFAMAETAFVSVRRTRIKQMVEEGNARAKAVQYLLDNPTRLAATTQVGITLVSLLAAILVTIRFGDFTERFLTTTGIPFLADNPQVVTLILVWVVVGFLMLVIGEIAPKSIAMQHADKIALFSAGIIRFTSVLMSPIIAVVSFASDLVARLAGARVRFSSPILTEEEFKMLVDAGEEEGVIEEEEKEMIHSIFEFTDTIARQVMVPRIDMKCIEVTASLDELLEVIMKHGHSRIPVYEETVDRILGVVHAKDLLPVLKEDLCSFDIRQVMRPAYFIPETKKVDELLAEFKRSKIQMAIVRDEYGGTAGLVTLEDLLEEIVGDIMDEYDVEELMIDVIDENTAIANARMNIDDLNEQMNLHMPESEDYETIGGFVFGLFGRQPNEGESIQYEDMVFTVEKTEGGRLHKIRVAHIPSEEHHKAVEKEAVRNHNHNHGNGNGGNKNG